MWQLQRRVEIMGYTKTGFVQSITKGGRWWEGAATVWRSSSPHDCGAVITPTGGQNWVISTNKTKKLKSKLKGWKKQAPLTSVDGPNQHWKPLQSKTQHLYPIYYREWCCLLLGSHTLPAYCLRQQTMITLRYEEPKLTWARSVIRVFSLEREDIAVWGCGVWMWGVYSPLQRGSDKTEVLSASEKSSDYLTWTESRNEWRGLTDSNCVISKVENTVSN